MLRAVATLSVPFILPISRSGLARVLESVAAPLKLRSDSCLSISLGRLGHSRTSALCVCGHQRIAPGCLPSLQMATNAPDVCTARKREVIPVAGGSRGNRQPEVVTRRYYEMGMPRGISIPDRDVAIDPIAICDYHTQNSCRKFRRYRDFKPGRICGPLELMHKAVRAEQPQRISFAVG